MDYGSIRETTLFSGKFWLQSPTKYAIVNKDTVLQGGVDLYST